MRRSRYLALLCILFSISLLILLFEKGSTTLSGVEVLSILLPIKISGVLFTFLGVGLFFYLYPREGLIPLIVFHFLVGNFFILLSEFPGSLFFLFLFSLCLVFIPPTLIHFTSFISGTFTEIKNKTLFILPYGISFLILLFYLYAALRNQRIWHYLNSILLVYLALAYLSWITRLVIILKSQHLQTDKVFARYLLIGQLVGFLLPLSLLGIVSWTGVSLPLNFIAPFILLFPLSLFFSLRPALRQQIQTYLVQSEKRVAFGDLLTNLSHELNNPLNFVYASLDPLKENLTTIKNLIPRSSITTEAFGNIDKLMTHMKDGIVRARDLVATFRDFPTAQKSAKEKIQIVNLIDKCIELLAHRWKDRIQIKKNYEANSTILGRPLELEQAFTNLLANACDATPKGGAVLVSTHQAAGGVKIVIRDTGKGISREVISRIFDPFFTTKPQGEGKGIGLAITLQIIKNHKGSIDVHSEEGRGTEFVILLPLS